MKLIFNLFKRATNICDIMEPRWVHYPINVITAETPFIIPYETLEAYDPNHRLGPEHAFNVFSFLLKKRLGNLGMFSSIYFYDPIYGYCTCNAVITQYNNNLNVNDSFNCDCGEAIISNRKSPPPPYKIIEDIEWIRKADFFPEGFVEILTTDLVFFGSTPIYLISSLNVMDVKQTSKNVFDVGIVIHVIYYYMDEDKALFKTEVDFYHYANDYIKVYYERNKDLYVLKCKPIIEEWLEKGLILKDEFFVHLFTLNDRFLPSMDENYELIYNKFEGLYDDRIYIREKDFSKVKKK